MHIFFDFELDDKIEQPINPKNFVYEELRSFFMARYKVLEEEIDNFQQENEIAFVVLHLKNEGLETQGFNIPEHLKGKLKDCITEDDFNYITDKIWYKVLEEKRKN